MRSRSSKMTCRPRFESSMANGVPPWPLPITITSAFFTSAIPPHRLLRDLVRVILDGKASPNYGGHRRASRGRLRSDVDLSAGARRLCHNPVPLARSSVGANLVAGGDLGDAVRPAALYGVYATRRDRPAAVAALSDARPGRRRRRCGCRSPVLCAVSFRIGGRSDAKRIFDAWRQRLRDDRTALVSQE